MPQSSVVDPRTTGKVQAWNPKTDWNKELTKELAKVGQSFFSQTTIHGLKYILEPRRSRLERGFWILAVFCSCAFAAFMIIQVILISTTSCGFIFLCFPSQRIICHNDLCIQIRL